MDSTDAEPTEEELRELRRQRYIQGLCVDCGDVEHSAGRPRCDECHKNRGHHGTPSPT